MKFYLSSKVATFVVLIVACLSMTLLFTAMAANKTLLADSQPEQQVVVGEEFTYLPVVLKMIEPLVVPTAVNMVPILTNLDTDAITDITHAGDGRLFIVQRNGFVRVIDENGQLLPKPFLDISRLIANPIDNWELGALGLAFHPNFPNTPYVYISYTSNDNYRIHIDRYTVDPAEPNVVAPTPPLFILQIPKTGEDDPNVDVSPVHNGGDLVFGPDGYLYISVGDGGPDPHFGSTDPHDPANNGQRTDVLLGKILRIDVNGTGLPPHCHSPKTSSDGNYTIPPDNPFVGKAGCDEIWATGLRNPWRISFDAETGDLYISDVGEWIQEEINFEPAGFSGGNNYGWRCFEGTYDQTIDHPAYADRCEPASAYDMPIHAYTHAETSGCAVTGGFVYRGTQYPTLRGLYVFSDFCSGQIWVMGREGTEWRTFLVGGQRYLGTYGEGVNGELYAGTALPGSKATLYRLVVP